MSDTDLAYLPATEIRSMIAEKKVSSVEVTKLYLDRIDALDSQFNSYLTVTSDLALEMAAEADKAVARGDDLGPLHGARYRSRPGDDGGIRTTSGSLIYADRIAAYDSVVVERVKQREPSYLEDEYAGYGLLGHTENRLGDHCRNRGTPSVRRAVRAEAAGRRRSQRTVRPGNLEATGGSIRIPAGSVASTASSRPRGGYPTTFGPERSPLPNCSVSPARLTRTVEDSAVLLQSLQTTRPSRSGRTSRRARRLRCSALAGR